MLAHGLLYHGFDIDQYGTSLAGVVKFAPITIDTTEKILAKPRWLAGCTILQLRSCFGLASREMLRRVCKEVAVVSSGPLPVIKAADFAYMLLLTCLTTADVDFDSVFGVRYVLCSDELVLHCV